MLKDILPAALGLLGGAAEYFILSRIVSAVVSQEGKIKFIYILSFMLLPMALLLPVAFIVPDRILLCGSCAAGVLILTAVIHYLRNRDNR